MDENMYKPNSHKYKEEQKELAREQAKAEEKRVNKIINGTAKAKQNKIRKFSDVFFAEDIHSIGDYILNDVLIPATKRALYDILEGGLSMSLFGGRGRDSRRSTVDRVSYRDYNGVSRNSDNRRYDTRERGGLYYDDIVLDSRGECEAVLSAMGDIMDNYAGVVRVADLYDLVGMTPPHTANKYGWTNIRAAKIVREPDGKYRIEMPKAMQID